MQQEYCVCGQRMRDAWNGVREREKGRRIDRGGCCRVNQGVVNCRHEFIYWENILNAHDTLVYRNKSGFFLSHSTMAHFFISILSRVMCFRYMLPAMCERVGMKKRQVTLNERLKI
jgi:hypothetical protein